MKWREEGRKEWEECKRERERGEEEDEMEIEKGEKWVRRKVCE